MSPEKAVCKVRECPSLITCRQKYVSRSQLAEALNISSSSLHSYEKQGLVIPEKCPKYSHVLYNEHQIKRAIIVTFLKENGFSGFDLLSSLRPTKFESLPQKYQDIFNSLHPLTKRHKIS